MFIKAYRKQPRRSSSRNSLEGWIDADTTNTSCPGNKTVNFTVIDETWWGSYTLRAFNLSKTDGSAMTDADNIHLRIYVPVN